VQMKTRVAGVLATSVSAVALMGGSAFAAPAHHYGGYHLNNVGNHNHLNDVGNVSILSGNTVNIPITAPINICGNAVAVLGFAEASCQGGAGVFLHSFNSGW
jgi:hypothetical protein